MTDVPNSMAAFADAAVAFLNDGISRMSDTAWPAHAQIGEINFRISRN